jgi:glutamate-1-semialdehyde 2,1-aminomutase
VGGTLAGNALSLAAVRATLAEVLTDAAFDRMIALATHYTEGVERVIDAHDLPWSITQLGARAEFRFTRPAPRNGTESERATDAALDDYFHVFLVNRDVLLTPFHNMALMCPATTPNDVDLALDAFAAAVQALVAS